MSHNWSCPMCGCTTNHFNATRGRMVCDACGAEVHTEAERTADIAFQRDMALAKQHLRVGNWEDAKRIVKPYEKTKPADKQIYLYLLAATTKCYEDLLLDNPVAAKEAEEYWKKLERLGCVNATMKNYANRREIKIRQKSDSRNEICVVIVVVNVVLSLITFALLVGGDSGAIFSLILSIVGWVKGSKWMRTHP